MGRTRSLVSHPCQDACGTVETDRRVEGAPVYRCPGCDSEWIDESERTQDAVGYGQTGITEEFAKLSP